MRHRQSRRDHDELHPFSAVFTFHFPLQSLWLIYMTVFTTRFTERDIVLPPALSFIPFISILAFISYNARRDEIGGIGMHTETKLVVYMVGRRK